MASASFLARKGCAHTACFKLFNRSPRLAFTPVAAKQAGRHYPKILRSFANRTSATCTCRLSASRAHPPASSCRPACNSLSRSKAKLIVSLQAAVQAYPAEVQEKFSQLVALNQWTQDQFGVSTGVQPKVFRSDEDGFRVGLIASRDAMSGQVLLQLPDKAAVTSTDAMEHPVVGPAARSCSGFELSALALWLMAERAAGEKSFWSPLLQALPEATDSPILWEESERQELLMGSSIAEEASEQAAALEREWQRLHHDVISDDPQRYPTAVFNQQCYLRAFSVVAAYATFLPSAECWALLPLLPQLKRNADEGATVDFDLGTGLVQLTAGPTPIRAGVEVRIYEERANGELLLATGTVIPSNSNDFVLFKGELVQADRYWQSKRAILEQLGLESPQTFPVYKDKMPLQLFAYLRLARIQEPLLFAKVSFEKDVKLSDMNEYEILQLLLGDCREKLFAFSGNAEDDVKLLQDLSLSRKARLASQLRLGEKQIVASAMDAVRKRLAPIRGIPVKGGAMEDPNKDILEVFEFIEALPQQPGKFFRNVFGLDEQQR